MSVSIIIVNYNTAELTAQCINSIKTHTRGCEYEIEVVDNASSDGSAERLAGLFPDITLICSDSNLGFGGACNMGVAHSFGDWLFFLNSDCLLKDDAVSRLVERAGEISDIGAAGCALEDAQGHPLLSFGEFPSPRGEIRYLWSALHSRKVGVVPQTVSAEPLFVDFVWGADMLMRRSLFESLGGFDKEYFLYYEETDLQKRISNTGRPRVLFTDISIIHLEGGSFSGKGLTFSRFMHSQKSYNLYMRKHYSGMKYVLCKIFIILLRSLQILTMRWTLEEKAKALRLIFNR